MARPIGTSNNDHAGVDDEVRRRHAGGASSLLAALTVADIMTREVVTLRVSDNLDLAQGLMELGRFRHIPVVDERHAVVGLLTHRDFLHASGALLAPFSAAENRWFNPVRVRRSIRIAEVMVPQPLVVSPTTRVVDAARLLRAHQYGCLPVTEGGRLVGIITEADFLRLVINALEREGQ